MYLHVVHELPKIILWYNGLKTSYYHACVNAKNYVNHFKQSGPFSVAEKRNPHIVTQAGTCEASYVAYFSIQMYRTIRV